MAGSNTLILVCPSCKHPNSPRGKGFTLALTCSKCNLYFRPNDPYWEKFIDRYTPVLFPGTKGKIKGITYEVMGFVVRRERKHKYRWREYFLFNPYHGSLFLSEYDGHWNVLKANVKHPWLEEQTKEELRTADGIFKLYSKFYAEVVYAQGEFFEDIVNNESVEYFEYINPPYLLTCERDDNRFESYYGHYIKGDDIAKGFGISRIKLPAREGMGYTQPLAFSFNENVLFVLTGILLLLSLLVLTISNISASDQFIYRKSFNQADLNDQKMFSTESFHLDGGRKNLVINVTAPISNDWFFAEYSLINEKTEEEFVFTQELEYYYGYEGGESWKEGSPQGEAFLSSIPGGDYHINIYPEFSSSSHSFDIAVWRDAPYYSNFFVFFFAVILFPVGFYIYKYNKEKSRWESSDYSPYTYE